MRRREFLLSGALAAVASRARATTSTVAPRIAIVGGGFAGSACALHLRKLDARLDITLIDRDARYFTCPMSNEVIVGARAMDSITLTRAGLEHAGVRCVRARVIALEGARRTLRLHDGRQIPYDLAVVAPGIRFRWDTLQGYDEKTAQRMPHAWQAGAQTELLARQLRAMRDSGVIAICVPAGLMRCPPAPFERASLIAQYLKQHKPRAKVLIFDSNNHFPRQDVFASAWREFYPGMIEWISVLDGGAVTRVDAKNMTLYTSNGTHRVDVANVIPAQAPGQLALDAGLASGHGWCPIDPVTFESKLVRNVHVIGDACIADAMPKSASAAVSQARQCASAIVASLAGNTVPSPNFESVCYSALGSERALAIHGRFEVRDGAIRDSAAASKASESPAPEQEMRNAETWYRAIRREAFGES